MVEIRGHLIDSGTLSRVLNDITEYGGWRAYRAPQG